MVRALVELVEVVVDDGDALAREERAGPEGREEDGAAAGDVGAELGSGVGLVRGESEVVAEDDDEVPRRPLARETPEHVAEGRRALAEDEERRSGRCVAAAVVEGGPRLSERLGERVDEARLSEDAKALDVARGVAVDRREARAPAFVVVERGAESPRALSLARVEAPEGPPGDADGRWLRASVAEERQPELRVVPQALGRDEGRRHEPPRDVDAALAAEVARGVEGRAAAVERHDEAPDDAGRRAAQEGVAPRRRRAHRAVALRVVRRPAAVAVPRRRRRGPPRGAARGRAAAALGGEQPPNDERRVPGVALEVDVAAEGVAMAADQRIRAAEAGGGRAEAGLALLGDDARLRVHGANRAEDARQARSADDARRHGAGFMPMRHCRGRVEGLRAGR